MKPLIDKISESRCIKACEEVKEARRSGANRPFPQQRDFSPIRAVESFVGRNDPKEDTCGHGTTTAGLLLRVAPDADIYIAKVANGIKFEDIGAVVRVSSACPPADECSPDVGSFQGHTMGGRP